MSVAGYKLKVNGGAISNLIIDVGNVLTYPITGLTYGVTYGVQVAAYDENGIQSAYCDPVYLAPLAETLLVDGDGNAMIDDEGNALTTFL